MSLALTSGLTFQTHDGAAISTITDTMTLVSGPLRDPSMGDDFAVSPLMGGVLEVMTPALPIPLRPRLFFSGELLTFFAPRRAVAFEGDPSCLKGPEGKAVCAKDEDGTRGRAFGIGAANGLGTQVSARVDTLAFGLTLGAAFPFEYRERNFRLKPSVGWLRYKVEGFGVVVAGDCGMADICTDYLELNPSPPPVTVTVPGFNRETILRAQSGHHFNAIGPGLDLEMDAWRYGPVGVALFMGARAYAVLGDRNFSFRAQKSFNDAAGNDVSTATYKIKVDPWLYRASIGIRFLFLGGEH